VVIKISKKSSAKELLDCAKQAVEVLKKGGVIIFPTETVYGIGADINNKKAVEKIYKIKKRSKDKPLSLHVGDLSQIDEDLVPGLYSDLTKKYWPGPLTLILENKQQTIGIRYPDNKIFSKITKLLGNGLAGTSVNLSTKQSAYKIADIEPEILEQVDLVIDSGVTKYKKDSTILDLSLGFPKVVREGCINKKEIFKHIFKNIKSVLFVCTGNTCRSPMAEGFLKHLIKNKNIKVNSAGILAGQYSFSTQEAVEVMKKHKIDISKHRSQPVIKKLIDKTDCIVVMDIMHKHAIIGACPYKKANVFLLKEFLENVDEKDINIKDPIGGSLESYRKCCSEINKCVKALYSYCK
jgi:L-threonylcarbamoyladenylate synthase